MQVSHELFLGPPPKATVTVNVKQRTIWLDGVFDPDMTKLRTSIREIATADGNDGKAILIVINSPGGSAQGMFAVMEEMDLMRRDRAVTFTAIVQGEAMSAGLILLQHCDRRIMGKFATLMAHGVSYGARGDIISHETELELTRRMTARIAEVFASRTGKPASYWSKTFRSNRPVYYDATEALAAGLVDEIVGA